MGAATENSVIFFSLFSWGHIEKKNNNKKALGIGNKTLQFPIFLLLGGRGPVVQMFARRASLLEEFPVSTPAQP